MASYDPDRDPDPSEWLLLDESERMEEVLAWHRRHGIEAPNLQLHARFHVIVETQLAEDEPDVLDTLDRLIDEGLDRHEAIHAIGFVAAQHAYHTIRRAPVGDPRELYLADVRRLTAQKWKKMR
jgi:hypothetical protein